MSADKGLTPHYHTEVPNFNNGRWFASLNELLEQFSDRIKIRKQKEIAPSRTPELNINWK